MTEVSWPTGSILVISSFLPWLLVFAAICKFLIYPAFVSPLSRIPNAHWSSAISSAWILWVRFQRRENAEVHAAHLENGHIVRLGPNEISINCIDGGVRIVYGAGFEKGDWYSLFDNYGVPCMFSSLHSRPHSVRKRFISHVYSKSTIHASAAFANQAATIIYSRLLPIIIASTHSSQIPQGIDVHDLWNGATMDFITAYQFGLRHSTNFLKDVAYRHHWLELYNSRKTYTFFPQEMPQLTRIMHAIGIRLVPRWVDWDNQEIEAWCEKMCKTATMSRKANESYAEHPGDESVVLNALLSGIEKEKETKGLDSVLADTTFREPELSVASEMLDHAAAGAETSGITLTYLTWHLSHDIALQNALRTELLTLDKPMKYPPTFTTPAAEKAFDDGQSSWLNDIQMPNSKRLDSLPILHAVIMETLRLKTAIPGSQPRMTPFPSAVIGSYDVPGGVRIGAAAWSLHRNVKVFPYPDLWDHTRWLENAEEEPQARKERDKWFWAFSSGGRMCVGSNFAMFEIKLIIAAIYTNFTSYIVNDDGIEQKDGYTCPPENERLFLRFEKVSA